MINKGIYYPCDCEGTWQRSHFSVLFLQVQQVEPKQKQNREITDDDIMQSRSIKKLSKIILKVKKMDSIFICKEGTDVQLKRRRKRCTSNYCTDISHQVQKGHMLLREVNLKYYNNKKINCQIFYIVCVLICRKKEESSKAKYSKIPIIYYVLRKSVKEKCSHFLKGTRILR